MAEMEPTKRAWEVFRSVFTDGDTVVVEDSEGRFFKGKLKAHDLYVRLTRSGGNSVDLDWDDIEFMAHDGFPVRKLMGMNRHEAELRAKKWVGVSGIATIVKSWNSGRRMGL